MNEQLTKALRNLFESRRIVFWYDPDGSMRDGYEALVLDGVEKIELKGNPFGVKYRILKEKPTAKLLVYSPTTRPEPSTDWLYDLELRGTLFSTDEVSTLLTEFALDETFRGLLADTLPFFKSGKRASALKALVVAGDTPQSLVVKMLGICCGVKGTAFKFEHILWTLLADEAVESETKISTIKTCNLLPGLWRQLRVDYAYADDTPGIWRFATALFHDAYFPQVSADASPKLNDAALAFFNDWKGQVKNRAAFETLSERAAQALHIESDLANRDMKAFRSLDTFEGIDRRILTQLTVDVESGARREDEVLVIATERQNGHWYEKFEPYYRALQSAASFLQRLGLAKFDCVDVPDGVAKYAATWSAFDHDYRLFCEAAADRPLLAELKKRIDGLYVNSYLMPQAKAFQSCMDGVTNWSFKACILQRDFWRHIVEAEGDTKLCVVISDAFRYEVAQELVERLLGTNNYNAEVRPMVASLPSYTQLGMASLLPHGELSFATEDNFKVGKTILSDGESTAGLPAREALFKAKREGAVVKRAEDFLGMSTADVRALTRDCRLLVIYHDAVDAIGHKRPTERKTFEACRTAVDEVARIVQRVAGERHISKFFITADHGFLYQDVDLDESDFIEPQFAIGSSDVNDRRCLLGRKLEREDGLMYFASEQLGLQPGVEVALAKGVTRMRQAGACMRFTHGGASLQEIVVPLVSVTYRRKGTEIHPVEVDIMTDDAGRITTGQVTVRLYQREAVAEKVVARTVRVGLYKSDGTTLISDRKTLTVNSPSDLVADRMTPVTLTLTHAADTLGRVNVLLKVESRLPKESVEEYEGYRERTYLLNRAFKSDFD